MEIAEFVGQRVRVVHGRQFSSDVDWFQGGSGQLRRPVPEAREANYGLVHFVLLHYLASAI